MHFSSLSTLRQRRESNSPSRRKRVVRTANFVTLAIVTAALIFSGAGPSQAVDPLPCDIYATAGAPCVAAHSTTRALYTNYVGSLYRVSRASDGAGQDIGLLSTGGYSNAATQDTFCAGTTCLITKIYDQSPRHNDLTIEGSGGAGSADVGAPADALPVIAGGHSVYGIEFSGQMGYRDNTTSGVAVGGQPEGMYMVILL